MTIGFLNTLSLPFVRSLLILPMNSTWLLHSLYSMILLTVFLGLYLLHLARGVASPRTFSHSTLRKPSRGVWLIPLAIVSAVLTKVVMVFAR